MVAGYLEDQSSLQSKLLGCYGVVVTVNKICAEPDIIQEAVELGCNNIEILQRAIYLDYFISLAHTHFNLATLAWNNVKISPVK